MWSLLGAITVILLLGTGLFTQNVVTQRLEKIHLPNDEASMSVTQNYDVFTTGSPVMAEPLMESCMLSGLVAPETVWASGESRAFTCPTDNCTFGAYTTLSVCPLCIDRTNEVTFQQGIYTLTNSNLTLRGDTGLANFTSDPLYPQTPEFTTLGIGPLIFRYEVMARKTTSVPPLAMECVAYWCISTYTASSRGGNLSEQWHRFNLPRNLQGESVNLHTTTNYSAEARTSYGQPQHIYIEASRMWLNGTEQTDPALRVFAVSAAAQAALQDSLMAGLFDGKPLLEGSVVQAHNSSRRNASSLAAHLMFGSRVPNPPRDSGWPTEYGELEGYFVNMAMYMEFAVRMGLSSGTWFSSGMTETYTFIFHIRWPWMAYPISTVLLVSVFVGITWHRSRGEKRWKSSVLPVLIHGPRDYRLAAAMTSPASLRSGAKGVRASLSESGGRMVWRINGGT